MFTTERGKEIGTLTKKNADLLRRALSDVFERSIVGQHSEVRFFDHLLNEMERTLKGLQVPGLNLRCRIARTHQKPRVRVGDPYRFSCELADLLVVVKYRIEPHVIERKSLFYQVKLCDGGTNKCKVDQNQLELLTSWPRFGFGRTAAGSITFYDVTPKTLELGSYMLMLRAPAQGNFISCRSHFCNIRAYGISPEAAAVESEGPRTVDISSFPYAANAAEVFFSHLAFEIGEHHDFNADLANLVGALYRHLGIAPDPPGEFDDFIHDVNPEEEPGFGIIEITVGPGEDFWEDKGHFGRQRPPTEKVSEKLRRIRLRG